jgi:5'-methylthioinosine phosphorylase
MWALKEAGAEKVIAVAAVGGIRDDLKPCKLVIPDQIIDYTWSRVNTYFEEGLTHVTHIDFTQPYCQELREILIKGGKKAKLGISDYGTYAATQGPRLETAAEILRLERDGCDMVGMTGMPEAALARELELCYATCGVVANRAAGKGEGGISMQEIEQNLKTGMEKVRTLLEKVLEELKS